MDITSAFKSHVKTLRTKNKAMGLETEYDLFSKPKKRSEFAIRSKNIVSQITQLRDFLLEHRKAYLNFSSSFGDSNKISDLERDKIDTGAQQIIKTCSLMLSNLKKEVYAVEDPGQPSEAQKCIVDLIEVYLKSVCNIYSEQKAIRVKWIVELQKVSKLEHETSKMDKPSPEDRKKVTFTEYPENEEENLGLTTEELQMFKMENDMLYNDLNYISEEVQEIQSKVVKISQLQQVFTEKVLHQSEDIERINSTIVGTTENLKDANTQIRQAIQNNAGLRICILFFILVMSFALLFLDWYND